MEYKGDNAAAQAEALRKQVAATGVPDVFVVSGAGEASVCAGRFSSWTDKKARDTLMFVHHIRDPDGQYPFAKTLLTAMPEPMPENPWPLTEGQGVLHAPGGHVGRPRPQRQGPGLRRRIAGQGYEAYVHHGPQLSIVTIGAFGPKIFDHPELLAYVDPVRYKGPPMPKPRIIDPTVLALMQQFPSMRIEGKVMSPEMGLSPP